MRWGWCGATPCWGATTSPVPSTFRSRRPTRFASTTSGRGTIPAVLPIFHRSLLWIHNDFFRIRVRLFRYFRIWFRSLFRIVHELFFFLHKFHLCIPFLQSVRVAYFSSFSCPFVECKLIFLANQGNFCLIWIFLNMHFVENLLILSACILFGVRIQNVFFSDEDLDPVKSSGFDRIRILNTGFTYLVPYHIKAGFLLR